jgi:hypothetical protein
MVFDRPRRDEEAFADLAVADSLDHQTGDLPFTIGQLAGP